MPYGYPARRILGRPARIPSQFSTRTNHAAEDNAVCAIEFENKAVAVAETSLVSGMNPEMPDVNGAKGVLYGKPAQYGLREGRELTEAACRSHRERREIAC